MQVEGEPLEAPRTLPWYPDALGWHMAFSRAQLRKLPILKQVHELIIRENDAGAITRQEAVSMIPPLLLDVQAHHRVSHFCDYDVAAGDTTMWVSKDTISYGLSTFALGLVVFCCAIWTSAVFSLQDAYLGKVGMGVR